VDNLGRRLENVQKILLKKSQSTRNSRNPCKAPVGGSKAKENRTRYENVISSKTKKREKGVEKEMRTFSGKRGVPWEKETGSNRPRQKKRFETALRTFFKFRLGRRGGEEQRFHQQNKKEKKIRPAYIGKPSTAEPHATSHGRRELSCDWRYQGKRKEKGNISRSQNKANSRNCCEKKKSPCQLKTAKNTKKENGWKKVGKFWMHG